MIHYLRAVNDDQMHRLIRGRPEEWEEGHPRSHKSHRVSIGLRLGQGWDKYVQGVFEFEATSNV